MKKLRLFFSFVVIVVFTFALTGCFNNTNGTKGPETFDEFTDNLADLLIGEDELTCNFLFEDRSKFNIEHFEPSLPTPGVSSPVSQIAFNTYFGAIQQYDYKRLNFDQKMTYNVIMDLVDNVNKQTPEMSYLSNNYLGTYLGYQAQLPLLLAEYKFREEIDVINYLKLLALVPETFQNYIDFEVEKADHGYGMPAYVIDNVVNQAKTFNEKVKAGNHFLIVHTNNKIDECTFLSDEKKADYKRQNLDLVQNSVVAGYQLIIDQLHEKLDGRSGNDMGLYHSKNTDGEFIGRAYYEGLFQHVTGYDYTCEEAIRYINAKLEQFVKELDRFRVLLQTDSNFRNTISRITNNDEMIMTNSVSDQLALYQDLIKKDFPDLGLTPNILVKNIDESMQDNFSPAAYMMSPLDNTGGETVYLNPASIYIDKDGKQVLDGNYLYTTLAHEALPGHLYQNLYFKNTDANIIRKIIKNIGYSEGWATYAQNYSYKWLEGKYSQDVIDYLVLDANLKAAIHSRLDLGIHYEGWTMEETLEFMSTFFNVTTIEQIEPAYHQICEVPTNFQEYFFTYLKLCDLHDLVEAKLGSEFNPMEFHKIILDCGPIALKHVEDVIKEKYNMN